MFIRCCSKEASLTSVNYVILYKVIAMATNVIDSEIRKFLPLLGKEDKKSLLTIIKNFLNLKESSDNKRSDEHEDNSSIDYTKYRFPVSDIKFNRDEINER